MEKIAQGAEAVIYRDEDRIVKVRLPKKYRIKQLDDKLIKYRTRREIKILTDMRENGIPVPRVMNSGKKNLEDKDRKIEMEFIEGKKVLDVLNSSNCESICHKIGKYVAEMHELNIIHGDLTTSNMIFKDGKVYFIDFGLGRHSNKIEDKAIDLIVFERCLRSSHIKLFECCWKNFLSGYKKYDKFLEIMNRIEKINKRRRYT